MPKLEPRDPANHRHGLPRSTQCHVELSRVSEVLNVRDDHVVELKTLHRTTGRGWAWLADGVRIDQHMVCAVVDVAHTITIAALHSGDLQLARSATETALLAAPYEDTPRLDLAAVVAAEGDRQAAERMLRDDVSNRADDGDAPDDLPERTAELVASAPWLRNGCVA